MDTTSRTPVLIGSFFLWVFVFFHSAICFAEDDEIQITDKPQVSDKPKKLIGSYSVLAEKNHDTSIFTQGFEVYKGTLYESSGLYGKSFIRQYSIESGEVIQQVRFPTHLFAEGLTKIDDLLYVLTWRAGELHIYDAKNLTPVGKRTYRGQGWGLTYNGEQFIMSNGTSKITFRNRETFQVERSINVTLPPLHTKEKPWPYPYSFRLLNELEFAQDHIWANVWKQNVILKIEPNSGEIVGVFDMTELVIPNSNVKGTTVLNGIAFDPSTNGFWITGKFWPKRYLVKFNL